MIKNTGAVDARASLIKAGLDPGRLDTAISSALYLSWRIPERIKTEATAQKRARAIAEDAQCLAIWVGDLVGDIPTLFEPLGEDPAIEAQELTDKLHRVYRLAMKRKIIARNYRTFFGVPYRMGGADEIKQEKAARRFAIGHLALLIKKLDPKGRSHSKHVVEIAKALFPRDDVPELDEKEVGEYRATAARSGLSHVLWDV